MATGLKDGIAADRAIHLCIDMQRMFAEVTPWRMDWMAKVIPVAEEIARRHAARTIFTRFMPPHRAESMPGRWRAYYERWPDMTRERLPPLLLDLAPPLAALVPPARIWDKQVYSPFTASQFHRLLQAEHVDSLVVTGGETDICVLATVLDAVDLGYRTILVQDALCSVSDESHDAMLKLYGERFSQQIELCDSAELMEAWRN